MQTLSLIIGLTAVAFYFLGYPQKKRENIIALNVTSRLLYILQYILLGAFEGAALDIAGAISSVLAGKKNSGFVKKHTKLIFSAINIIIIAVGLCLYKNVFSLLPIAGVLLHTVAFWIDDEKIIRIVSMAGSPFWLVYNFVSRAYGSCVGDLLSMVSIGISMYRYDIRKAKDE